MQLELMRMSVLPRAQADSFERQKPGGGSFTREEWLRAVFSSSISFAHRGVIFHYVPDAVQETDFITGKFGRSVISVENEPPEKGLAKTERDAWRAASVIIDPRHHEDGQKAAVEHVGQVGRPIPILESLVEAINRNIEPYFLDATPIVPSDNFWSFARSNLGEVTFLEFEFIAPNMFGGAEDYDLEMRDMKENEKIQKAKLTLESKDGLNLDTQRVKKAVDYTSRGTGSIKARTKRKKTYNSRSKAQRVTVESNRGDDLSRRDLLSEIINNKPFGKN